MPVRSEGLKHWKNRMFDNDPIRVSAAKRLGIKPSEVTPEQRREEKALFFGVVYGSL